MRTTISSRKTWWSFFALVALAAALAVGLPAMLAQGADHLDAPLVQNDGRLDINDVYAFQSPTNPNNTVFIMTVNPLAGILSPTAFHPKAEYQFLIDNDVDGKRDMKFKVKFSKEKNGRQKVKVNGHGVKGKGKTGENISLKKGGTLRAGVFDDPFFFDLVAFQNALGGTGTLPRDPDSEINGVDFFAGTNVSAIVLELPSEMFGSDDIGVWAITKLKGKQIDRLGRPVINTVFIPAENKDAFNAGKPRNDRRDFNEDVVGSLLFLSGLDGSGYSEDEAQAIANVLLPDILTINTSVFPSLFLNGRKLEDDVIDIELPIATGGFFGGSPVLTTDEVPENDVPFLSAFPYLAEAH